MKNGAVLTGLISALLLFIKQVTEIFGIDLSHQLEIVSAILGSILAILVNIGVITNPNTKGVSDAGIDLELNKPRDQHKDPVIFEGDSNIKTPVNFDTSQPFTDDSDDVVFDVNQYEANDKEV